MPNCVTDHETDCGADHVQGEPLAQKSCSWKNINEEIIVEDFFNSEDKDQDIEILESTEKEPAEENIQKISVTDTHAATSAHLIDILTDPDFPEEILWRSVYLHLRAVETMKN